jgi:hypothetical protein
MKKCIKLVLCVYLPVVIMIFLMEMFIIKNVLSAPLACLYIITFSSIIPFPVMKLFNYFSGESYFSI